MYDAALYDPEDKEDENTAPPRRNLTNSTDETLHGLAAAIRDQVSATNRILQHMQNNNGGQTGGNLHGLTTAIRDQVSATNRILQHMQNNNGGQTGGNLHDLTAAIRDQVSATNRILQHIQNNDGGEIGGNHWATRNDSAWSEFMRARPPSFQGSYDPVAAERWLRELEKFFEILGCTDEQRVTLAVYMLKNEAKNWWKGARELLLHQDRQITWQVFQDTFLERYFPSSVRVEKEIEFFQLRQGNMSMDQYITRFEELSKFSAYLKHNPDEAWKAIKFEAGLNPKIKNVVVAMEIREFVPLINKCRLLEKSLKAVEDEKQKQAFWKRKREMNVSGRSLRGKGIRKGKKFQVTGNRPLQIDSNAAECTRCGCIHGTRQCYAIQEVCFVCGQKGHYARECPQNKGKQPEQRPQAKGRVFTLNGKKAAQFPKMIQGEGLQYGKVADYVHGNGS